MLKSDQFSQVGQVLKSNGADGSLVIRLYDNYYERGRLKSQSIDFSVGFFSRPFWIYFDSLPVPFFATPVQDRAGSKLIVKLTGISSQEDADEIAGRALYIEEEKNEEQNFAGWRLFNTASGKEKPVGTIKGMEDIPGNPLLILESDGKEKLIPLNEELVSYIDEDGKTIGMSIPEGLL